MLEQGVIIIAVGDPQYGRLAYNLALTIKAAGPAHITVVRTSKSLAHLNEQRLNFFDNIIDLPTDAPLGCGAKIWAYDISPYKKTLLLDADMLWLPEKMPGDLFFELDGTPFTAITEGYDPGDVNNAYFFWANPAEIRERYTITADKLYQWRSEVMYFERCAQTRAFFTTAKKVYRKPMLTSEKLFANGTADELAIGVAAGVHNMHPHKYKWSPSYWHLLNGSNFPGLGTLYANYWLVSFGARWATENSKNIYNRLVKAACYKIGGVQHVFPLISKKEYLKERQHI